MPVRWQTTGDERLWIRVHVAGMPWWIALPVPHDAQAGGIVTAVALSLILGLLAALTGYLIQRHINRPLQELADAARRVSAGDTLAPLPIDGPTQTAQVSTAFNQLTSALHQAESTRPPLLACRPHSMRTS